MAEVLLLLAVVAVVLGGVALLGGLVWWANWRIYGRFPTFEQYQRLHPESVKNGQCRCHHCGGGRVFLQHLDGEIDRRRHLCVTCGTVLYRSRT